MLIKTKIGFCFQGAGIIFFFKALCRIECGRFLTNFTLGSKETSLESWELDHIYAKYSKFEDENVENIKEAANALKGEHTGVEI